MDPRCRIPQHPASYIAVACLMALTVAACTNTERQAAQAQGAPARLAQAANPCAAKAQNPCAAKAANPCAVKAQNPCAAKNPCAMAAPIDPGLILRPTGTTLATAPRAQLLAVGERLWNDRTLGTSGLACSTCHMQHANFNPTFTQAYPHAVAMPRERAGVRQVHLDEMVQFCMVVPMAAKPLPWNAQALAALTAYSQVVQQDVIKAVAANPCALKPKVGNPCNPCAVKNPCAGKK